MSEQGIRTPFGIIPMDDIMEMLEPLIERDREIERLRIIEDRYNSIKQMHDTGECRACLCWFCEEERLERIE